MEYSVPVTKNLRRSQLLNICLEFIQKKIPFIVVPTNDYEHRHEFCLWRAKRIDDTYVTSHIKPGQIAMKQHPHPIAAVLIFNGNKIIRDHNFLNKVVCNVPVSSSSIQTKIAN